MNTSLSDALRIVAAVAAIGCLVAVLASFTNRPEYPKPAPAEYDPSNPFDPSKGSGHLVSDDAPRNTEKWPKTYTAPDGVNTITENEDGTGSMTMAWAPKPKAEELAMTLADYTHTWVVLEEAVKKQGKHVITQAEAEEVVRALAILTRYSSSRWAYEPSALTDLSVGGSGWVTMSSPAGDGRTEAQKLEDEAESLEASAKFKRAKAEQMKNEERDVKWAMATLAKWRKRVEEGRP